MYLTTLSMSTSDSRLSRDSAIRPQQMNLVSFSPHTSPAKLPLSCCKLAMSAPCGQLMPVTASGLQLTSSYLLSTTKAWSLKFMQCIYRGEYLHGTRTVQHMRVMPGCRSEASVSILARQDKSNGLVARQAFWVTEEMQSCQAPVDTVQSQLFSQPVLQLVSSL
jgi:hypothetical protein